MKSADTNTNTTIKHSDHWKMFKVGRTWVFSCMAVLTMLGAGSAVATSTVSAAEEAPQAQVAEADSVSFNPVTSNDTTVTGTGPAFVVIELYTSDYTSLGKATADGAGHFSVTIPKQSAGSTLIAMYDINGETQTTEIPVANAGETTNVEITSIADITADDQTLTGVATKGSSITVTAGGKTIGTGKANNSDGAFSVSLSAKQPEGTTLTVTATLDGKTSTPEETQVKAGSTVTAIAKPEVNPITEGDSAITGTGVAGTKININKADGTSLGAAVTVGSDGKWSFPASNLVAQEVLSVTATDGKNTSDPVPMTVKAKETTGTLTTLSRGTLFRPPFVTLFRIETPLFRRDNVTFLIPTLLLRQIIPSSNLNQTNRSASADH